MQKCKTCVSLTVNTLMCIVLYVYYAIHYISIQLTVKNNLVHDYIFFSHFDNTIFTTYATV